MQRLGRKSLAGAFAGAVLLLGQAACTGADRSGVQLTPTAEHPCPPWVEFPADRHNNADSIYLGCINAINLRNTVEDPNDLAQGRPLGPASGTRETLGIDAYDQGKIKNFKDSGSTTSTIVVPNAMGGGTQ